VQAVVTAGTNVEYASSRPTIQEQFDNIAHCGRTDKGERTDKGDDNEHAEEVMPTVGCV